MNSDITFSTINFTGTPNEKDIVAAKFRVNEYNAANGTSLPTSPGSALKTSYLTVRLALLQSEHERDIIRAARQTVEGVAPDKILEINSAIAGRLLDGEAVDDIITDLQS